MTSDDRPVILPGDRDDLVRTVFTGHGLGHQALANLPSLPSRVPTPGPQPVVEHQHGHRVPRLGREL